MKIKNILCIDDEQYLLNSLKYEIKSLFPGNINECNYDVITVNNSKEAIKLACSMRKNNQEIPLMIVDYVMPIIRGDKLLKELDKIYKNSIKVMLTGQATKEGLINAKNYANVYRVIEKPWARENLKNIIEKSFIVYEETKKFELDNKTNADYYNTSISSNKTDLLESLKEPLFKCKSKIELIDKILDQ